MERTTKTVGAKHHLHKRSWCLLNGALQYHNTYVPLSQFTKPTHLSPAVPLSVVSSRMLGSRPLRRLAARQAIARGLSSKGFTNPSPRDHKKHRQVNLEPLIFLQEVSRKSSISGLSPSLLFCITLYPKLSSCPFITPCWEEWHSYHKVKPVKKSSGWVLGRYRGANTILGRRVPVPQRNRDGGNMTELNDWRNEDEGFTWHACVSVW